MAALVLYICTSSYFLHKKRQVLVITQKFLFLWKSLQHQPIQHQYSVMFCHNISYRLLKCAQEWWPGKCLPGYLGGRKWGEEAETIWILLTDWQPYNNSSNNTYLRLRLAVVEHAGLVVGRVHLRPSVTCAVPVNKPWRGKQTDSRKSSFEHRKHFHHTLSGSDNLLAAPFRHRFLLWQQELTPKTSLKKKKSPPGLLKIFKSQEFKMSSWLNHTVSAFPFGQLNWHDAEKIQGTCVEIVWNSWVETC